jgi:hypothetical protein
MNNIQKKSILKNLALLVSLLTFPVLTPSSNAFDPIIRPYQTVRTAGMGNIRYTTGIYEDNFYANPARITENPKTLFQFPKITLEAGGGTISSISDMLSSSNGGFDSVSNSVGKPLSARFQMLFPAFYKPTFFSPDWAFAFGIPVSAQVMGQVSQSGLVTPTTVIGGGPTFSLARRLLPEERLSIGTTIHGDFRATAGKAYNLYDLLRDNIKKTLSGGSGLNIDFDLGSTFRPHWGLGGFNYEVAFTINNVLGGTYDNLGGKIPGWDGLPTASPRSFNAGLAARKDVLWEFTQFMMALEFTDMGANGNGSIFREIHFGAEASWKWLRIRSGINQGYFCGGLGFYFGHFKMDLATYGEEMGLNVGNAQDRRYALDFGFHI